MEINDIKRNVSVNVHVTWMQYTKSLDINDQSFSEDRQIFHRHSPQHNSSVAKNVHTFSVHHWEMGTLI